MCVYVLGSSTSSHARSPPRFKASRPSETSCKRGVRNPTTKPDQLASGQFYIFLNVSSSPWNSEVAISYLLEQKPFEEAAKLGICLYAAFWLLATSTLPQQIRPGSSFSEVARPELDEQGINDPKHWFWMSPYEGFRGRVC